MASNSGKLILPSAYTPSTSPNGALWEHIESGHSLGGLYLQQEPDKPEMLCGKETVSGHVSKQTVHLQLNPMGTCTTKVTGEEIVSVETCGRHRAGVKVEVTVEVNTRNKFSVYTHTHAHTLIHTEELYKPLPVWQLSGKWSQVRFFHDIQ